MRIPLSWLAESVDLADRDPQAVLASLVRVGLEEEAVHRFEASGPIVVGQVLSAEPEPQSNGKTINWCQVRVAPDGERAADGGDAVRGIVCGAHNFHVGDKVVVTLPGSVLPGDFRISARKTYGHLSDGMMASARELGLGDEHAGIVVLAELGLDPEPGQPALPLLGMDDVAVEINVTPDRGYCFSIRGVAREYSHSTGVPFTDPVSRVAPPAALDGLTVSVHDDAPIRGHDAVAAFTARVVDGVRPDAPTPAWMVARLQLAGVRSVSAVVDVTNYVMLETGQPLHAYDANRVSGGFVVRRATPGEHLTTLDGKDRALDPEDLVVADESGAALGLAGVMGGQASEVTEATRRIIIEAAAFDPISVARTARRHKLPSEASKRFERGVDPRIGQQAAQRAVDLITEIAGGADTGHGAHLDRVPAPPRIELAVDFPARLVGIDYAPQEVESILRMVGADVERHGDVYTVVPPSWRPDLTEPVDLVEEVARIADYARIPSRLPVAPPGHGLTFEQRSRRRVSEWLAASGLTEVSSYPFLSEQLNALFAEHTHGVVRLANALDAKEAELRTHVLPGLLGVAKRNADRGLTDVALFETGRVFRVPQGREPGVDAVPGVGARPDDATLDELFASVPDQPRHVAGVAVGAAVPRQPGVAAVPVDWQQGIEHARRVAWAVGLQLQVRAASRRGLHPGRGAELLVDTGDGLLLVGFGGELHPDVAAAFALPGRVAVFELDLDALIRVAPRRVSAKPVITSTPATQDLSLVVPVDVPAERVRRTVLEGAGELLESARLTMDYRGDNVPAGTRSLTFALLFRAPDRTLTAAEATAARDAAVALAAERFGASLRA